MAAPLLVIIQGAPGVGKTTLLKKLRQDFTMPMLGKDEIKEFLFDTIPQSDREFSRLQGAASFEMMYAFARTLLDSEQSLLLEGAYGGDFGRTAVAKILSDTGAQFLEIFCFVDDDTRQERFRVRAESGERHPAHMDGVNIETPRRVDLYTPFDLGDRIDIDTSEPLDDVYTRLVDEIKRRLV